MGKNPWAPRSKGAKHSIAVAAALVETLHFDMPVIPRSMPSAIELDHPVQAPDHCRCETAKARCDLRLGRPGRNSLHAMLCCCPRARACRDECRSRPGGDVAFKLVVRSALECHDHDHCLGGRSAAAAGARLTYGFSRRIGIVRAVVPGG
jgi:hypothetical protein